MYVVDIIVSIFRSNMLDVATYSCVTCYMLDVMEGRHVGYMHAIIL